MTFESNLLATARRMPEASYVLRHGDQLFELWRNALHLPDMDREIFAARTLADLPRYAIEGTLGLALDPIWLAAVVCASAHLDLNRNQLMALREDIHRINLRVARLAKNAAEAKS